MSSEKKINIALLGAHIYSENHGCNALTYSAVALLHEASARIEQPEVIRICSYAPFQGWSAFLQNYPVEYQQLKFRRESWKKLQFFYNQRQVCKNDICFSSISGDSFSDIYGEERFKKIVRELSVPLKRNIPLILLPQTIGPFQNEQSKKIARAFLNQCQCVFVRDPQSRKCVEELNVHTNVRDSLDMALFMPYQKRERPATDKIRIGINVSGLLWNGGYTRNNMFDLQYEYSGMIRHVCSLLAARQNIALEFVGHVLVDDTEYAVEDDYRICKLLSKEFNGILAPRFTDPIEAKEYLSGFDAVIGSRMHCCIGAYSCGVPTYPISYSRKFTGLFSDGLNYSHLASHLVKSEQGIVSGISRFIDMLPEIRREIANSQNKLQQIKEQFIVDLIDIIKTVKIK